MHRRNSARPGPRPVPRARPPHRPPWRRSAATADAGAHRPTEGGRFLRCVRRLFLVLGALVGACGTLLAAGCTGSVPGRGGDPGRTRPSPSPTTTGPAPPSWVRSRDPVWQVRAAGQAYVALRLTAAHRLELIALSRRDGSTTARVPVDPLRGDREGPAYGDVTAGGGAVAYRRSSRGAAHDRLDLLDPVTLKARWSVTGPADVVAACGPVVCVWWHDRMSALDPGTGRVLWRSHDAGDWWMNGRFVRVRELRHWPGLRIRVADPRTGHVRWDGTSAGPLRGETAGFSMVPGSDGRLAVVAGGSSMKRTTPVLGTTVRDGATGRVVWSRTGLAVQVSGRVYLGLSERHVRVLDPDTGRTRRTFDALAPPDTYQPPAVGTDGTVWLPLRLPRGSGHRATFLPVTGPAAGSYDLESRTVVFAGELHPRHGRLRVGGRLRTVDSVRTWIPCLAGSGRPVAMPRDADVPAAAREQGETLPHLVDRDRHAILVRGP